jgi:ankyrin repeat protein
LERGAQVEVRDKDGNTPLIHIARKGGLYPATPELMAHRRDVAAMLILKGALFQTCNREHKNAIVTAVENYNEQLGKSVFPNSFDSSTEALSSRKLAQD